MTTYTAKIATIFTYAKEPQKLSFILDKVCDHRPWFHDFLWNQPEKRRAAANAFLAATLREGVLWEVWRVDPPEVTGIMLLNNITLGIDANCHFIFFDRQLAGKSQLCLEMMEWAFKEHPDVNWPGLEVLRIEIPTYAHALGAWARKRLGFRYEAEDRLISWPEGSKKLSKRLAELGSRKHKATLYKGEWLDALLLSVTKEEFDASYGNVQAERDTSGAEHRED